MSDLNFFQGRPLTTENLTTSTSETPSWMQQAIYDLVNEARTVQKLPYEQYQGERVAAPTDTTKQAWGEATANQGAWQPSIQSALTGTQALAGQTPGITAASPYMNSQNTALTGMNYDKSLDQLNPYLQQANNLSVSGATQPYLDSAGALSSMGASSGWVDPVKSMSGLNEANPYLDQAIQLSGLENANKYIANANSTSAFDTASPYLNNANQTSVQNIDQYMNPYNQQVTDTIAKLGARNLNENLLPSISDSFIKAGGFGGNRMGEFGSRALRDTQEAVLDAQGNLLNQGYNQAANLSSADLNRQAQLSQLAGSLTGQDQQTALTSGQLSGALTGQDQSALLQGGQLAGNLTSQDMQSLLSGGQLAGNLTNQDIQSLLASGKLAGTATGQDIQTLLNSGQLAATAGQSSLDSSLTGSSQYGDLAGIAGTAASKDSALAQSALAQMGLLGQTGQTMDNTDLATLSAVGQEQNIYNQKQNDVNYADWMQQQQYPQEQLDWLSSQLRGLNSTLPTVNTAASTASGQAYSPSPLSQVASALSLYKGLS